MLFEYQFGVMIEAESQEKAWEKVKAVSEQLDKLDVDGESAIEGPFTFTQKPKAEA